MTEQKQQGTAPATTMPHTWQKALEMWDAGEPVPVFLVESEGASQEFLWGEAFHCLAAGTTLDARAGLTAREADVVNSIVAVAKLVPWPRMIQEHIHAKSPAITIKKPVVGS